LRDLNQPILFGNVSATLVFRCAGQERAKEEERDARFEQPATGHGRPEREAPWQDTGR